MSIKQYRNMETFLSDNEERLFRVWVYRRIYTPYEQEKKFIDESEFDQETAHLGFIRESIALPDGDYLLGFEEVYEAPVADEEVHILDYYKLSEIRLGYSAYDTKRLEEEW